MENEITLLKNNDNKEWSDIEWIREFYDFMRGEIPEKIKCRQLNLSEDDAFLIIWYLQEHFPLLPDNIEKCDVCGELYDSYREGYYREEGNEDGHQFFCNTDAELGYPDEEEE